MNRTPEEEIRRIMDEVDDADDDEYDGSDDDLNYEPPDDSGESSDDSAGYDRYLAGGGLEQYIDDAIYAMEMADTSDALINPAASMTKNESQLPAASSTAIDFNVVDDVLLSSSSSELNVVDEVTVSSSEEGAVGGTVVGTFEEVEVDVVPDTSRQVPGRSGQTFKRPKRPRSPLSLAEAAGPSFVPNSGGFFGDGKCY